MSQLYYPVENFTDFNMSNVTLDPYTNIALSTEDSIKRLNKLSEDILIIKKEIYTELHSDVNEILSEISNEITDEKNKDNVEENETLLKKFNDLLHEFKEEFKGVQDKFVESDNTSALLVCMDTDGIMWEEIGRNKYQKAIQLAMEEKGYKKHKALCFSPYEDWTAAGESTRKKAPYFLINIAETDALNEAHRSLWKTKYFDNFTDEEVKKLKVYPKNKKVINEKNNKSKSSI